ncbi:MAG: hypothetical protein Fur006_02680 [Coleofasciculaceae cyanobacterium]
MAHYKLNKNVEPYLSQKSATLGNKIQRLQKTFKRVLICYVFNDDGNELSGYDPHDGRGHGDDGDDEMPAWLPIED